MHSTRVTLEDWRRLVDEELAGKAFDDALVHEALAGVAIAPLYTEAPRLDGSERLERSEPFRVCMRHGPGASVDDLLADVAGGADALWFPIELTASGALDREELAPATLVLEATRVPSPEAALDAVTALPRAARFALAIDPIAWRAAGALPFSSLRADLDALGRVAAALRDRDAPNVVVSTVPYHEAGADAADEIAVALSTGASYLEALVRAGLTPDEAARAISLRVTVGRDTFVELCKLRALRTCWAKVLVASGASPAPGHPLVHAVSSTQTLTVRDPWVNMLRVTTQVFAAVMGGAELVTPLAFDEAFGAASPFGRRVARNTGLVLREESALGKVSDPAGGAYYFDSLTDALGRAAWARLQELARGGGIVAELESGRLPARLEAAWARRLERIAKREVPILGVSVFANLDESLPHAVPRSIERAPQGEVLGARRDAAPFEALRARADALAPAPEVLLATLGSFAESRPRAGFASSFFAAGGLRTREQEASATRDAPALVCLCGTDERYADEAAAHARALKAAGAERVFVAGRPGALEPELRAAGVDGFIFVGCDVVATLSDVLSLSGAEPLEGAS